MSPHAVKTSRLARRLLALAATQALLLLPASARAQAADHGPALARIADAVCGKELVVLGQLPSHGEARGFEAKRWIVERLVTKCGFDAVLFEAPVYDFVGFEIASRGDSATQWHLDRAIGRLWLTRELTDWRRWLFRRATGRTLLIGGLDDQVSITSEHARATLPGLVAASLPKERAAACGEAVARHLHWRYDASQRFDAAEKERLSRCTGEAAAAVAARVKGRQATPALVMLENLAGYVGRQWNAAEGRERDEAMHRNLLWHAARMPKGSKVIVWTATTHAARLTGEIPWEPLGARIAERWGNRAATIGFTAFAGQSSTAGQPSRPLAELPAGSLEERATTADSGWVLLDRPALRKMGVVPSRLLGRITAADWSTYFDFVLAIREEVAPTKAW